MHILQLVPSLEVGGVERGVLDLSRGLITRGHRVSVVSSGGSLVGPLVQAGARHYTLPVHAKSLSAIRACLPAVQQLIQSTAVDLVHARSRIPGWIGWIAARRTQRPFVTTAHGFYAPHLGSRVMVWGRVVIAPSEALGRYLIERFNLPKARLRIIPRGVDLSEFTWRPPAAPQGSWRLGVFGRFSPLKGQAIALRACALLRREGIEVTVCFAGDRAQSPMRRALESLVRTLRLESAVEWLGVRQDVAALIASMDLMAVPSTYPESFGRGVIEAQAVGRPVVASRIGALEELIADGEDGLLVPPNDPRALAEAIKRFIEDAALRRRCIEGGRRRVEGGGHLDRMIERTLAVYEECLQQPRILIWKLTALGDVILATPSLRAIRRHFPTARLTLAVGRAGYAVVARCPYLDEILLVNPTGRDRRVGWWWAFVRRLRRGGFDLSIDLQNSRTTHLAAWLAGIPVRAGYQRKFGGLLNRGVRLPRVVLTPIAHQQYLLRQVGVSVDGDRLELWPSALDDQHALSLLGPAPSTEPRPQLVGIHPGGSGRWQTKRWDLERWARLCNVLTQRGIRVVVTGGPEERPLGEQLARLTQPGPLLAIGRTSVLELACLIKRCDVFVAHDSATLHVAAAVGTPTVALFGPTDPRRHLASTFIGQVIKKELFCSPCYSARCRTVTHACMKRIGVEEVLHAVLGLLADAEARATAVASA